MVGDELGDHARAAQRRGDGLFPQLDRAPWPPQEVEAPGDEAEVPTRLIEIARMHDERYSGLNPQADDAVDAAMERGEEFIDFEVTVPERIKQDTVDLGPVLMEVDEYCRNGDLLTLSPPDDVRAFWIWFLGEFVRQLSGEPPLAWRDFSLRPA